MQSTQRVPLAFDEYTFIREYWENKETRELIKALVPKWIALWTPEGKTADEAQIVGFFLDHPIIKLHYIANGECTPEQIMELVKKCEGMTYVP